MKRKIINMKAETLASNTIMLTIGEFLNKGLQFLMIPLFSMWLDTASYGKFDLYCTYISLFTPVITLSIQYGVFRFSAETKRDEEKHVYITNGLIICLLNFFLVFIGGIIYNIAVEYSIIIILFLIYFLAEAFRSYLGGVLRAMHRLDIYSYCSPTVTVCIFFSTFIFVNKLGLQLEGILLGYGIGTLLGDIIMCMTIRLHKMFRLRYFKYNIIKQLVKYSFPLISNDISWWIINASDRKIIDIFWGAEYNGIYALAYKVPNLCASIFGMFSLAWQQEAVRIINEDERNEKFNNVLGNTLKIILSMCILITSSNFIFFDYIFDSRYHEGILYAPLLISSVMIGFISQYLGGIQMGLKNSKENGISVAVGAISNVAIHLLLVKSIGLWAAVLSTVISGFIVALIRLKQIKKYISLRFDGKSILLFVIYLIIILVATVSKTTILKWSLLGFSVVLAGIVNYKIILRFILRGR